MPVTLICTGCGREFQRPAAWLRKDPGQKEGKFCSRACHGDWKSANLTGQRNYFYGRRHTKKTLELNCQVHLGKRFSPEVNAKKGLKGEDNPFFGKHHTEATRQVLSRKGLERASNPEWCRRLSEMARLRWSNSEYRQMMVSIIMQSIKFRPTSLERKMQLLLDTHFPGEWRYTGDGSLIIGGYNPDFIHRERKLIIEVFGRYWHTRPDISWDQTESGRIMAYASLRFHCLVVWEEEFQSPDSVLARVQEFIKGTL